MSGNDHNDSFEAPAHRHHPGKNARPAGGQLEDITSAAAASDDLYAPATQRAWRYGLFLIRSHCFWEAHEVLEPVWMSAPPNSRERYLVQGMIQLANACLKSDMGRRAAADRLVEIALGHIRDARTTKANIVLGLNVAETLNTVGAVKNAFRSDTDWRVEIERMTINAL